MNERIRELDKDAQEYAGRIAGNDEDSNYTEWFTVYKAKFAELIVQECAIICNDVGVAVFAEPIQNNFGTAQTCKMAIEKHFGVE